MDSTILSIITAIPTWEEGVWNAIQNKNLNDTEKYLKKFLLTFSPDEWDGIFWSSIIQGIPAVRGDVDETSWKEKMVPAISKVLFSIVPPLELDLVYEKLDIEMARRLHNALIKTLGDGSPSQKLEVLKKNYPNFYSFFVAVPGQVLGMDVVPAHSAHPAPPLTELEDRLSLLPKMLKNGLISYRTAEEIYRIGQSFHISDEKISDLAKIVGLTILGVVRTDELDQEIHKALAVDARTSQEIANLLEEEIFSDITEEVEEGRLTYVPGRLEDDTEVELPVDFLPIDAEVLIKTSSAPTEEHRGGLFNFPTKARTKDDAEERDGDLAQKIPIISSPVVGQIKSFDKSESKPFVLYEDKAISQQVGTTRKSSVGFSVPFGFFNKGGSETTPIKAQRVRATIGAGFASGNKTEGSGILGKILKKEAKKTVHYSGARTEVTPFKKDANIFESKSETARINKTEPTEVDEPVEKNFIAKTAKLRLEVEPTTNHNEDVAVKQVSAPMMPLNSEAVKKNPFGFPPSIEKPNGAPKIDGNTIHLK